jgi:predicted nucleic acid-binding protein
MKILIDTNVLIDYLSGREPYFTLADEIIKLCRDKKIVGYMAAHSVPNMFFILRKEYTGEERRTMIKSLFDMLSVSGIDEKTLLPALDRENFKDFEDCLQDECAVAVFADYVVTRNVKDFINGKVTALTPEDFLQEYQKAGTQP